LRTRARGRCTRGRGCGPAQPGSALAPGEFGADVALGSTQRFGTPLGYAAPTPRSSPPARNSFVACLGGSIGRVRRCARRTALRMALQTREQHIPARQGHQQHLHVPSPARRDGEHVRRVPRAGGIRAIADRVARLTAVLAEGLARLGLRVWRGPFFDTVRVEGPTADVKSWHDHAEAAGMNFRPLGPSAITISLDETPAKPTCQKFWPRWRRGPQASRRGSPGQRHRAADSLGAAAQERVLQHPVFAQYHSETEMLPLHAAAGGTRSLTDPLHDPARLVHHEAEWHGRDGAISWPNGAGCILCADPTSRGLPSHVPRAGACSGDGHVFGACRCSHAGSQASTPACW